MLFKNKPSHHTEKLTLEAIMANTITGGCCCERITFTIEDRFHRFYFCHCKQCRKLTGTAHASNLFTEPDNIKWIKGKDKTTRYDHAKRTFSKVFCSECGSSLPFLSKDGQSLIVPAGSLNDEPSKQVDTQIFCEEQTQWYKTGLKAKKISGFMK